MGLKFHWMAIAKTLREDEQKGDEIFTELTHIRTQVSIRGSTYIRVSEKDRNGCHVNC